MKKIYIILALSLVCENSFSAVAFVRSKPKVVLGAAIVGAGLYCIGMYKIWKISSAVKNLKLEVEQLKQAASLQRTSVSTEEQRQEEQKTTEGNIEVVPFAAAQHETTISLIALKDVRTLGLLGSFAKVSSMMLEAKKDNPMAYVLNNGSSVVGFIICSSYRIFYMMVDSVRSGNRKDLYEKLLRFATARVFEAMPDFYKGDYPLRLSIVEPESAEGAMVKNIAETLGFVFIPGDCGIDGTLMYATYLQNKK